MPPHASASLTGSMCCKFLCAFLDSAVQICARLFCDAYSGVFGGGVGARRSIVTDLNLINDDKPRNGVSQHTQLLRIAY